MEAPKHSSYSTWAELNKKYHYRAYAAFALLIEQNCTNTECEGRIQISKGKWDEKYKNIYS